MRMLLLASVVFSAMGAVTVSAGQNGVTLTGTVKAYVNQGGFGHILLNQGNGVGDIVVHVTKDTKITRMVDGKKQPAKYEDVRKDDPVRATYDGYLGQSLPPQAWATELVILKAAK